MGRYSYNKSPFLPICFLSVYFPTGENLVNGVQCEFQLLDSNSTSTTKGTFIASPLCSSDQDSPIPHILEIPPYDRIVSVSCRSGALVDFLEIVTLSGLVLRAGGSGGGDTCKVRKCIHFLNKIFSSNNIIK